jgi:predicted extracellular nuclease
VQFVDRKDCGADRAAGVTAGPALNCSPGLVDPGSPAFNAGADGHGGSRKPLAGEFLFNERRFFVVNLHLRSKGGDDPIFGRRQPRRTASTARRTSQAEVVAGFVNGLLRVDENARVVVLGDLNDFEDTEPLYTLETAGLEDLILRAPGEDRYTYVYTGLSQVLDHVLVSAALADGAEVDAVHVNADFPAAIRASDHDPVVVRLTIP